MEGREIKCLFLGYAANHARSIYRMLNLKTNKVLIAQDVRWLNTLEPGDNIHDSFHNVNIDDDDYKRIEKEPAPPLQATGENERKVASNQPCMAQELRILQAFNNPLRLEIEGDNSNLCLCRRLLKKMIPQKHSKRLATITTSRNVRIGGKRFDWY